MSRQTLEKRYGPLLWEASRNTSTGPGASGPLASPPLASTEIERQSRAEPRESGPQLRQPIDKNVAPPEGASNVAWIGEESLADPMNLFGEKTPSTSRRKRRASAGEKARPRCARSRGWRRPRAPSWSRLASTHNWKSTPSLASGSAAGTQSSKDWSLAIVRRAARTGGCMHPDTLQHRPRPAPSGTGSDAPRRTSARRRRLGQTGLLFTAKDALRSLGRNLAASRYSTAIGATSLLGLDGATSALEQSEEEARQFYGEGAKTTLGNDRARPPRRAGASWGHRCGDRGATPQRADAGGRERRAAPRARAGAAEHDLATAPTRSGGDCRGADSRASANPGDGHDPAQAATERAITSRRDPSV